MAIGGSSAERVDLDTAERYASYQWRKLFPGAVVTHQEFLDKVDIDTADWDIAFAGMEARIQEEAIKKASDK